MSRRRFAKRHASVESPREVPLHIEANASFFTAQDALLAHDSISPAPSPPHSPSPSQSPPDDEPLVRPPTCPSSRILISRPLKTLNLPAVDRHSAASLPLPSQIPFHALLKTPEPLWHPPMRCPPLQEPASSDSSSSSNPSSRSSVSVDSSEPTTQSSRSSTDPEADTQRQDKQEDKAAHGDRDPEEGEQAEVVEEQPLQVPSSPKSPSPQHQVTMNDSPLPELQPIASPPPPEKPPSPPPPVVAKPAQPQPPIQSSVPAPRPVSPFRAPMPPPQPQSRTSAWADHGTAMRRFMTPAQLQHAANSNSHIPFPSTRPPQPSTTQPASSSPPFGFASASTSNYQQRYYPPQQQVSYSPTPLFSSGSSTISYPPPELPTILPGETEDGNSRTGPNSHLQAPYASFLSRAPQPADTSIMVETSRQEYKLNIRLPGFDRDSITLAAKRRRVLHIMADSWVGAGGHFERRISFGYDAELGQVRAEFDGEMLRITVPRRELGFTWSAPVSSSGRGRI